MKSTWRVEELTSTSWNRSKCTCYLGYFCKICLFSPFIYFHIVSGDNHVFLFYTLGYNLELCYLFFANIVPHLGIGKSLVWLLFPFDISLSFCFWVLPSVLCYKSYSFILYFSFPSLESTIAPRSPASFYWRLVFRNKT